MKQSCKSKLCAGLGKLYFWHFESTVVVANVFRRGDVYFLFCEGFFRILAD